MTIRKWIPLVLPLALAMIGTHLQRSSANAPGNWETVLTSLYCIPIVIAAIRLSTRTMVIVALVAGATQGLLSVGSEDPWIRPIVQTLMFLAVGLTAVKVAEWRRASSSSFQTAPREPLAQELLEIEDSQQMPLGRVVACLVRQFRTPVTSIEGAGWVLEDPGLPIDKRLEFAGIIRKESHRLNRVLSDVLDFTRPVKPRFQMVELPPLVDEVIQLVGPRDHGPFFLFRNGVPPDFPLLRCDPEQIKQVLINLAMNSIQATPGGGQIEISGKFDAAYVAIRVIDHGRGIPPSIVNRIFDPFFSTHDNSLGIGLTVARHLVSAHGGKMAVEHTAEKGTCIAVWLPVGAPVPDATVSVCVRE